MLEKVRFSYVARRVYSQRLTSSLRLQMAMYTNKYTAHASTPLLMYVILSFFPTRTRIKLLSHSFISQIGQTTHRFLPQTSRSPPCRSKPYSRDSVNTHTGSVSLYNGYFREVIESTVWSRRESRYG